MIIEGERGATLQESPQEDNLSSNDYQEMVKEVCEEEDE